MSHQFGLALRSFVLRKSSANGAIRTLLLCLHVFGGVAPLYAQQDTTVLRRPSSALRVLGSSAEDRVRLAQLAGAPSSGALLRDGTHLDAARTGVTVLRPELRMVFNSGLATSLNDGSLWAGRGLSILARGGVAMSRGRVRLTLAPELTTTANRQIEVVPSTHPDRSRWSNPWRTSAAPADLPLRFGTSPLTVLYPGQSALTVKSGRVTTGISTGNLWWGPGIRNALLLSDQGPGIPKLFLKTRHPVHTPIGALEGMWFTGALTESLVFDTVTGNDLRAIAGAAVTLSPASLTGLTLGVGRIVVTPVNDVGELAGRAFRPFTIWNGASESAAPGAPIDSTSGDHLTAVFMRWIATESGLELWGELGWSRLPSTWRQWMVAPNADAAWTIGTQWAIGRPVGVLRLQFEVTELGQSIVDPTRTPREWYTGRSAVQGFTQRGQLLGASVGPGGSHQWLAIDRVRPSWSWGGFVARTRWENDALYRQRLANPFGHDVSLYSGFRGWVHKPSLDISTTIAFERRLNYQFESGYLQPLGRGQRNVNNWRVELAVTPTAR